MVTNKGIKKLKKKAKGDVDEYKKKHPRDTSLPADIRHKAVAEGKRTKALSGKPGVSYSARGQPVTKGEYLTFAASQGGTKGSGKAEDTAKIRAIIDAQNEADARQIIDKLAEKDRLFEEADLKNEAEMERKKKLALMASEYNENLKDPTFLQNLLGITGEPEEGELQKKLKELGIEAPEAPAAAGVTGQEQVITDEYGTQTTIPAGQPLTEEEVAGMSKFSPEEQLLQATLFFGSGSLNVPAVNGAVQTTADGVVVSAATYNKIRSYIGVQKLLQKYKAGQIIKQTGKNLLLKQRFPVNAKSMTLTKKILVYGGLAVGAAGVAVSILGSYPFASFVKEEALQTLSYAWSQAIQNDEYDEAEALLDMSDEMLNSKETIWDKIPFINVQKELEGFYDAQSKANEAWREILKSKSLK